MEINKQLFENVLSDKLKGTFVLRDGFKISHRSLTKCDDPVYPYYLAGYCYTSEGHWSTISFTEKDIIDFIPYTNMKENELTIEIPYNKVVDWDESKKQNKIILKDKQLTYEDICKKLFKDGHYYTDCYGGMHPSRSNNNLHPNTAATEHQLECILAKNKLANVAKCLNDGWKPQSADDIFLLIQNADSFSVYPVCNGSCASDCGSIWFKSRELAEKAIEILGEETIKLALEPLGI